MTLKLLIQMRKLNLFENYIINFEEIMEGYK